MVDLSGCGVPKAEVEKLNAQVSQLQNEKGLLQAEKDSLLKEKVECEKKLAGIEASIPKLKDPTYEEAKEFIRKDTTNEIMPGNLDKATYTVIQNARKQGLNSYLTIAKLKGAQGTTWSFYFVGFNTVDRGWVYFVATSDFEAKLEVGKKYYQINNLLPRTDIDDTILSIWHYPPEG